MVSDTKLLAQTREILEQALQILGHDSNELEQCSVPELATMLATTAGAREQLE
jgi:hypothetical protein